MRTSYRGHEKRTALKNRPIFCSETEHTALVQPSYESNLTFTTFFQLLTLSVPIPDEEKKLSQIFIFTLLCGASKGFMRALNALKI